MVECRLEVVTTNAGGSAFLRQLGVDRTAHLPTAENLNKLQDDAEVAARLAEALPRIDCSVEQSVADYISSGRRLDDIPSPVAV